MPLTINLPGGRVLYLDENTGNIVGEQDPENPGPNYPPHGGLSGSGATSGGATGTPLPPPPANGGGDEFDPSTDQVTDVVSLPGGKQVSYIGKDGKLKTTFISDDKGSGGVTASTAFSQQQQNARAQADLAEQQRQFNEMFGFNKAKYNQDYELERGKTLLSLGSRPDTLTRYLYAIRGLQPPQALGGQGQTLPGYSNIFATPQNQGGAPMPTGGKNAAPPLGGQPSLVGGGAPQGNYNINPVTRQPDPGLPSGTGYLPGPNPYIAGLDPKTGVPTGAPKMLDYGVQSVPGTKLTQGMTAADLGAVSRTALATPKFQAQTAAEQSRVAPGQKPRFIGSGGALIYGEGGVIPEPVVGQGMTSGQSYLFGEKGPETVVPATEDYSGNPQPDLMEIVKMFMEKGKSGHAAFGKQLAMMLSEKQGAQNSYASGGTIGYNPELFNPSGLSNIVNRGYNSTPDVPLLPSVGLATGGTSFIPSAQRLNNLLPSEQSSYAGSLQDEFGLQPDDVFSLAQKLAPKVTGLSTPRYS